MTIHPDVARFQKITDLLRPGETFSVSLNIKFREPNSDLRVGEVKSHQLSMDDEGKLESKSLEEEYPETCDREADLLDLEDVASLDVDDTDDSSYFVEPVNEVEADDLDFMADIHAHEALEERCGLVLVAPDHIQLTIDRRRDAKLEANCEPEDFMTTCNEPSCVNERKWAKRREIAAAHRGEMNPEFDELGQNDPLDAGDLGAGTRGEQVVERLRNGEDGLEYAAADEIESLYAEVDKARVTISSLVADLEKLDAKVAIDAFCNRQADRLESQDMPHNWKGNSAFNRLINDSWKAKYAGYISEMELNFLRGGRSQDLGEPSNEYLDAENEYSQPITEFDREYLEYLADEEAIEKLR